MRGKWALIDEEEMNRRFRAVCASSISVGSRDRFLGAESEAYTASNAPASGDTSWTDHKGFVERVNVMDFIAKKD